MSDRKPFLAAVSRTELIDFCQKYKLPQFRISQILNWVYAKRVIEPEEMKNLPKTVREELGNYFKCSSSKIVKKQHASDGTKKLLIELEDNETIEAVIIPFAERTTFCLSTQVGCPVQCFFCASGAGGLIRNLATGEIIEQLYHACNEIESLPDNIVFMGIGEGMLNYKNFVAALDLISGGEFIDLGARKITVSTSGWVPGIRKLADHGKQFNLAVSLHAPDDVVRAKLIPEKMRYPVAEIIDACNYYYQKTNRLVTFEYALIKGINDSIECAEALAKLAFDNHIKVNLIPYNSADGGFVRPSRKQIQLFEKILKENKASVTIRKEMGSDVDAACGQLRRKHSQENE